MAIYWIDAGVLITAKNRHYAFNLVPKFWPWLYGQLEVGTIRMPSMSFQELIIGNDDLAKWCKEKKNTGFFCVRPDREVQKRYETVAEYVCGKYKPHQTAEFLRGADGWIIAHALESQGFVVTEENTAHNKSKIKIPVIAKALHVTWKNTFDMCQELKANFS
jgi:hypothetical protein